ncbi:SDR family NAD(P)-dependent oxidoreductase [Immundisolibacter sp.]|uniref:SDR family NAD(P)-dependent oxidoreductase n=1 Tax=Immundisolibacter sp. TaxID=1934948 RepID=UPI003F50157A
MIGAGSGIGQATAKLFAEQGAQVVCGDLHGDLSQGTAQDITSAGGTAWSVVLDISVKTQVQATLARAVELMGGVDILVSTPFGNISMALEDLAEEQWDLEHAVLAKGTLFAIQAAVPVMRAQKAGVILVATASIFGDYGAFTHPAIFPAYGAAKGAQEMLIRVSAGMFAPDGIRVCGVQPGFTLTQGAIKGLEDLGVPVDGFVAQAGAGMPMGPGQPRDVAEGFLFLASDYASYINGYCLPVDGGSYAARFGRLLA